MWGMEKSTSVDEKSILREALRKLGKRGGKARAKALTAEQRRASALKASKAAAKKRTADAKARKKAKK